MPYEAYVLKGSKDAVRVEIQNNTDGNIDVNGARFVVDLYQRGEPAKKSDFAVEVTADSGVVSPIPMNSKSRIAIVVDGRSFQLSNFDLASICSAYRRDKFLSELARNNYKGGIFTCSLSIDLTASGNYKSVALDTNDIFCRVMITVLGDFRDYYPSGAKYREEIKSPSRSCP